MDENGIRDADSPIVIDSVENPDPDASGPELRINSHGGTCKRSNADKTLTITRANRIAVQIQVKVSGTPPHYQQWPVKNQSWDLKLDTPSIQFSSNSDGKIVLVQADNTIDKSSDGHYKDSSTAMPSGLTLTVGEESFPNIDFATPLHIEIMYGPANG